MRRYWVCSPAVPFMPEDHQAFHPSEVGKLVPASAGGEKSFVGTLGDECRAAASAVPFIILLNAAHGLSVVKRTLFI